MGCAHTFCVPCEKDTHEHHTVISLPCVVALVRVIVCHTSTPRLDRTPCPTLPLASLLSNTCLPSPFFRCCTGSGDRSGLTVWGPEPQSGSSRLPFPARLRLAVLPRPLCTMPGARPHAAADVRISPRCPEGPRRDSLSLALSVSGGLAVGARSVRRDVRSAPPRLRRGGQAALPRRCRGASAPFRLRAAGPRRHGPLTRVRATASSNLNVAATCL